MTAIYYLLRAGEVSAWHRVNDADEIWHHYAGAALELSDRSLVCLPSTTSVDGQMVSRITPKLSAGSIVTTPRHMVDVVITEYGVAELRGLTVRERARALATIGHPEFRDELLAVAEVWPT